MRKTEKGHAAPVVISSRQIKETPGAYWFEVVLSNGRTITMTVPK